MGGPGSGSCAVVIGCEHPLWVDLAQDHVQW
jgi:hypothetical protein